MSAAGFGFAGLFLAGGVEEVFDQGGAVMLADELMDDPGEAVLAGKFDAVFDVADDDEQAHGGGEFVMAVGAAGLVLDEILGLGELADVVVIGPDAAEEAVASADGVAGGLSEGADDERVIEGAGSFGGEAFEEGLVEVA